jgi:hypothetical protein
MRSSQKGGNVVQAVVTLTTLEGESLLASMQHGEELADLHVIRMLDFRTWNVLDGDLEGPLVVDGFHRHGGRFKNGSGFTVGRAVVVGKIARKRGSGSSTGIL